MLRLVNFEGTSSKSVITIASAPGRQNFARLVGHSRDVESKCAWEPTHGNLSGQMYEMLAAAVENKIHADNHALDLSLGVRKL